MPYRIIFGNIRWIMILNKNNIKTIKTLYWTPVPNLAQLVEHLTVVVKHPAVAYSNGV